MLIFGGLNTGVLWARPYESTYSILRRLLIANPALSENQIRTCCRSMGGSPFTMKTVAREIVAFEKQRYGHATTLLEFNNGTDLPMRGCPVCARQLYHTDCFRLPWLECCPLHHHVVVPLCPACSQPWPLWNQHRSRRCDSCGIGHDHHLVRDNRLSPALVEAAFRPLQRGLKIWQAQPCLELFSGLAEESDGIRQRTIDYAHPLMPDYLASMSAGSMDCIVTHELEPIDYLAIGYTQPIHSPLSRKVCYNLEDEIWCQVGKEIEAFVRPYKTSSIAKEITALDYSARVYADTNVYLMAERIWRDIALLRHSHHAPHASFQSLLKALDIPPLIVPPRLKTHLYQHKDLDKQPTCRESIPLNVASNLYAAELRVLFIQLALFLSVLRRFSYDKSDKVISAVNTFKVLINARELSALPLGGDMRHDRLFLALPKTLLSACFDRINPRCFDTRFLSDTPKIDTSAPRPYVGAYCLEDEYKRYLIESCLKRL